MPTPEAAIEAIGKCAHERITNCINYERGRQCKRHRGTRNAEQLVVINHQESIERELNMAVGHRAEALEDFA